MTTFALIHGACHGGWCFERLAPLLEAPGHRVVAPDLPTMGMGGAPEQARVATDALAGAGDDVVVVGHSLAGLVIPHIAAARPVRRLVYLCALIAKPTDDPDPAEPPVGEPGMRVEMHDDGTFTFPPDIGREYFYNRCDAQSAERAIARLRPQRPMHGERGAKAPAGTPTTYLFGRYDRAVTPAHADHVARTRLGVTPIALESDHSPFYSATRELATLLLSLPR